MPRLHQRENPWGVGPRGRTAARLLLLLACTVAHATVTDAAAKSTKATDPPKAPDKITVRFAAGPMQAANYTIAQGDKSEGQPCALSDDAKDVVCGPIPLGKKADRIKPLVLTCKGSPGDCIAVPELRPGDPDEKGHSPLLVLYRIVTPAAVPVPSTENAETAAPSKPQGKCMLRGTMTDAVNTALTTPLGLDSVGSDNPADCATDKDVKLALDGVNKGIRAKFVPATRDNPSYEPPATSGLGMFGLPLAVGALSLLTLALAGLAYMLFARYRELAEASGRQTSFSENDKDRAAVQNMFADIRRGQERVADTLENLKALLGAQARQAAATPTPVATAPRPTERPPIPAARPIVRPNRAVTLLSYVEALPSQERTEEFLATSGAFPIELEPESSPGGIGATLVVPAGGDLFGTDLWGFEGADGQILVVPNRKYYAGTAQLSTGNRDLAQARFGALFEVEVGPDFVAEAASVSIAGPRRYQLRRKGRLQLHPL